MHAQWVISGFLAAWLVLSFANLMGCTCDDDDDDDSGDGEIDDDQTDDDVSDDDATDDDDSDDDDSSAPTRPLLDLSAGNIQVPFPSFYFTLTGQATETGVLLTRDKELPEAVTLALEGGALSDVPETVPALDGFSILGPVTIPFSAPLDLPAWDEEDFGPLQDAGQGLARIFDISGETPLAIGYWYSFIEGQDVLVLRPDRPTQPGHRIVICLIDPILDAEGNRVERPALFDAIMNHDSALPQDPLVDDMIEIRDLLESGDLDLNPEDVLLAFSYVAGTGRNVLQALREAVEDLDAETPILPVEIEYESAQTIVGTYLSPDFRIDGTIPAVKAGDPVDVQEMVSVPFLIRLPATADEPLAPVIYLHGLMGSRHLAPVMEGMALFAIDALDHGDREEDYSTGPWPFLDLVNLRYFRDNVRQTAVDNIALARMIVHIAEDPTAYDLPEEFLAQGTIGVLGHSLGCINGSTYSAVDPAVDHLACVGGGGLFSVFRDLSLYGLSSPAGIRGLPPHESLIFEHLMQAMMDASDGAAVAPWLVREPPAERGPRNVLILEAVGDRSVPNITTEAIAWSAGLAVNENPWSNWFHLAQETVPVEGNLPGGTATGLLYEYDFPVPPVDKHGYLFWSPEQLQQVQAFFETGAASGVATIIDPEAP